MTLKECQDLTSLMQRRANEQAMLNQINAQPAEVSVEMNVVNANGVGTRLAVKVPKGILQQSLINRLRATEARIRAYGVEPT